MIVQFPATGKRNPSSEIILLLFVSVLSASLFAVFVYLIARIMGPVTPFVVTDDIDLDILSNYKVGDEPPNSTENRMWYVYL